MQRANRMAIVAGAMIMVAGSTVVFGDAADVAYPEGYRDNFVHYSTRNRDDDRKQLVKIFANDAAARSGKADDTLADGAVIVMEVYKARLDASETPIKGEDGYFETGDLVFVGVMEKRTGWGTDYPDAWRNGEWEYAGFDAKGEFIERDYQPCFECHKPFAGDDFMFSRGDLAGYLAK